MNIKETISNKYSEIVNKYDLKTKAGRLQLASAAAEKELESNAVFTTAKAAANVGCGAAAGAMVVTGACTLGGVPLSAGTVATLKTVAIAGGAVGTAGMATCAAMLGYKTYQYYNQIAEAREARAEQREQANA